HEPSSGPLLRPTLKLNMKTVGPKYSRFLQDVERGLAALNPVSVVEHLEKRESFDLDVPGHLDIVLDPEDVLVQWKAADGWAGTRDKGTQVAVDVRITPELARAGLAREVVRRVNDERKNAGLDLEDRIELYLGTSSDALREAIREHRDYIAGETLVGRW